MSQNKTTTITNTTPSELEIKMFHNYKIFIPRNSSQNLHQNDTLEFAFECVLSPLEIHLTLTTSFTSALFANENWSITFILSPMYQKIWVLFAN